jgi:hypothetical protein
MSEEEIEGAPALMESTAHDDLDGPEFEDAYTDALAKTIEAKREDRELPEAPTPEQPAQVLDRMAALNESVEKAKASRGKDADVHELPKKSAAKKAAKKQLAKMAIEEGHWTQAAQRLVEDAQCGVRSTLRTGVDTCGECAQRLVALDALGPGACVPAAADVDVHGVSP